MLYAGLAWMWHVSLCSYMLTPRACHMGLHVLPCIAPPAFLGNNSALRHAHAGCRS